MKRACPVLPFVLLMLACSSSPPPCVDDAPPPEDCPPESSCPAKCGEWSPEMATQVFSAKGLYRSPNYVSDVPEGATLVADNVVVPRPDIYETHRGTERLTGTHPGGEITAQTEFRGVLIGYASGILARYSSGTWVAYTGTYLPPMGPLTDDDGEEIPGKVVFHQTGDSLFFTTSKGVFRLEDPLSQPELSGVIQAIAGTATLSVGAGTALPPSSAVAYRFVWGKRTAKNRLILGAPSGRVVVYNTSTTDTKDVVHVVPVPPEVRAVEGYFLQAYRSRTFPVAVAPDDNMSLAYERAVTEIPAGASYTFTDIDPETRGAAAYFAPDEGDGLESSKFRPPLATDVVTFNGTTVYLNAKGPQSIDVTLLAVGGPNGVSDDDAIIFQFADGSREVYRADTSEAPSLGYFKFYTTGTPAQNIADTANSLLRVINARTGGRLYGQYLSTDDDFPGHMRISARALDEGPITVTAEQSKPFLAPDLTYQVSVLSADRVAGVVTVNTQFSPGVLPHGLAVGDVIIWNTGNPADEVNFPDGLKTVATVIDAYRFTYNEAGPNASLMFTGTTFKKDVPPIETIATTYSVAWSPLQEPDAVPILQNAQAGNPDLPVLRALLLDGSLYLLKRDGLFRLSGSTPNTLAVDAIDTTISFIAPWAAWTLGGRAYALTTEGLKTWSVSAKPQPASVPIERDLLDAISQYRQAVDVLSFVVNYESERRLYLWMPQQASDTTARFAYVYSYLTDTWTRYVQPAASAQISPETNRMLIAPPADGRMLRERKTRTNADFQGPDGQAIPVVVEYTAQIGGSTIDSKHWSRFYWHFEHAAPSIMTASFRTEITQTPQSVVLLGSAESNPGVVETLVPQETARSVFLYSRLQHSVPQEPFRLLGYSVQHRNYRKN